MSEVDVLKETFFQEALELFENLDSSLLDLEKDKANKELLNSIFRDFHTLKSAAGMFGFDILEKSTHVLEDLLDNLRAGSISINVEMMDVLFDSLDLLKNIFELRKNDNFVSPDVFDETSERLRAFLPAGSASADFLEESTINQDIKDKGVNKKFLSALNKVEKENIKTFASIGKNVFIITLTFKDYAIKTGVDPLNLFKALNVDGEFLKVEVDSSAIPKVAKMDVAEYYIKKITAVYVSSNDLSFVHTVFEFCADTGDVDVHIFSDNELTQYFDVKKVQKVSTYDVDSFWSEAGGDEDWVDEEHDITLPGLEEMEKEISSNIGKVRIAIDDLKKLKKKDINDEKFAEDFGYIFRFFHNLHTTAAMVGLDDLSKEAQGYEALLCEIKDGNKKLTNTILDNVTKGLHDMETILHNLAQEVHNGDDEAESSYKGKKLGEILVELNAVTGQDVDDALDLQQASLGEILVKEGKASQGVIDKALEIQKASAGISATKAAIKIDSERLDNIVDMVGELVITQTLVNHDSADLLAQNTKLSKNLAQLTKITKFLQDQVMGLRMLPIRQTFQRMARVVRDASKKSGKEVVFDYYGEDTEVDKTVIDQIGDPLIHILRNSVDHGIEKSSDRIKAGKSAVGLIEARAFHQGGNVVIEVKDDGGGLSRDKITAKAVKNGLIKDGKNLIDKEVYALLFEPGFSTAEKITEISGRGVGLDVVKRNVEKLRGKVDVTSEEGVGTTFSIKLPLTLAIIDGMILSVGDESYIIPTLSVETGLRPLKEDLSTIGNDSLLVKVREEIFPVIKLNEVFNHHDNVITDPTEATLILVESEGKRFCLMVDKIVEHQQVVIKSLGEKFKDLQGVSGCSILGDGKVALILDVSGLLQFLKM